MDQRTLDALQRLKNSPDFQLFVKHQLALYDYYKEALVSLSPADAPRMQGRAAHLQDFFSDLKKETK